MSMLPTSSRFPFLLDLNSQSWKRIAVTGEVTMGRFVDIAGCDTRGISVVQTQCKAEPEQCS